MINAIKQHIIDTCPDFGIRPDSLTYMTYSSSGVGRLNLIYFVFKQSHKTPFLIVKCNEKKEKIVKEFENLRKVKELIQDLAPKSYYCGQIENYYVLIMNFVPGEVLARCNGEKRHKILETVGRLIQFHHAVKEGHLSDELEGLIWRPIHSLKKYENSALIKRKGEELIHKLQDYFSNNNIPKMSQHGDLVSRNVLFNKDKVYFVDWESFGGVKLPLYDLVTLFVSLQNGFNPNTFQYLFSKNSYISKLFVTSLRTYCEEFSIDFQYVESLVQLAVINFFHQNIRDERFRTAKKVLEAILALFENGTRLLLDGRDDSGCGLF